MHLYRHLILEPRRGALIFYPRFFWTLYSGDPDQPQTRELFGGHIELAVRKPNLEFGLSFEVGTRGSETPFDGHIKIAGTALYWGIEQGSGLAQRLTQHWFNRHPNRPRRECYEDTCDCPPWSPGAAGKRHLARNGQPAEHMYDGRELELRTYEGRLWVSAWTPKGGNSTSGFASWRKAVIRINLLDRLLGQNRYYHEEVETRPIMVELPELAYPIQATLEYCHRGRTKINPRHHEHWWSVKVDASECKGIPYRFDHSGGYKGDRVYGFGVRLKERRRDWHVDAKAAIEAFILNRRAESGFRKALPLEVDG